MSDEYPPGWRPIRRWTWTRKRIMAIAHASAVAHGVMDEHGRFTDASRGDLTDEEIRVTERYIARRMLDPGYRRSYERALANMRRELGDIR